MRGGKHGNRGGGRPKGSKNKTTVAIKDCLQKVYDGLGGPEAMLEWAKLNQTDFYLLWGKQIPRAVEVEGGEKPLKIVIVTGVPDAEPAKKNVSDSDD